MKQQMMGELAPAESRAETRPRRARRRGTQKRSRAARADRNADKATDARPDPCRADRDHAHSDAGRWPGTHPAWPPPRPASGARPLRYPDPRGSEAADRAQPAHSHPYRRVPPARQPPFESRARPTGRCGRPNSSRRFQNGVKTRYGATLPVLHLPGLEQQGRIVAHGRDACRAQRLLDLGIAANRRRFVQTVPVDRTRLHCAAPGPAGSPDWGRAESAGDPATARRGQPGHDAATTGWRHPAARAHPRPAHECTPAARVHGLPGRPPGRDCRSGAGHGETRR